MKFEKILEELEEQKWCKIVSEIPYIQFPNNWQIQIIPSFGGALIRFRVKKNESENISIYLDWFDNLGCVGTPYWEIYPDKNGNNLRFLLNETDKMLRAIQKSLDS